jgi:uncharacterized protein (TIGR03083 family)
MSSAGSAAPVPSGAPVLAGPALLERAIGYTRASLQLVAHADLRASTPCRDWDLLSLLHHMDDSLAAFTDAAAIGYVDLMPLPAAPAGAPAAPAGRTAAWAPPTAAPSADSTAQVLVQRLKQRACAALGAWASPPVGAIAVADRELRSDLLAAAGALEITVHGWDVAQACGVDRPLPAALAVELLDVVPILVGHEDRPRRFAEPVDVPLHARPSTRLLGAVGRRAARAGVA